jgi:protein-tyrosine phosphatase
VNALLTALLVIIAAPVLGWRLLRRKPAPVNPETLIIRLPGDDPNRMIPLRGAVNFRDMGGYATADGRRVRKGQVYRAGMLANLEPDDLAYLESIGLKLVCDLRSAEEKTQSPDKLPPVEGLDYLHLPLDAEDNRAERLRTILLNPRAFEDIMVQMYKDVIVDRNATVYGALFRRIADPANLPTLIHCTAGKDRTGVGVALLLMLLGVPDATIVADYTLSNQFHEAFRAYGAQAVAKLKWLGIGADDIQPLLICRPETMQGTLDHIRSKYGGIDQYLTTAAGLDAGVLAALRNHLLEAA